VGQRFPHKHRYEDHQLRMPVFSFVIPAWFYLHTPKSLFPRHLAAMTVGREKGIRCLIPKEEACPSDSELSRSVRLCYFRLTSSVDAILCQDGPQMIFTAGANHVDQLGVIFHSSFAFFVSFRVPGSIYLNLHYE